MAFAALLIGAVLIVSAIAGTYPQLAAELEKDVPPFFTWALAIVIILGLGWIPGLKTVSRWLLALVVVVVVLKNWSAIKAQFAAFAGGGGGSAAGAIPPTMTGGGAAPTTSSTAGTATLSPQFDLGPGYLSSGLTGG